MATIEFEAVSKVYPGGTKALDSLDLTVEDGEFIVLVGPSGCGKTTALRMVAGLEEITAGQIRIGETIVNDLAPRERDVAMIFQNYALYPHMSVEENIGFGLKLRKLPKQEIRTRVASAARTLGLDEYRTRKPRMLSGGQRQRVAMGRAIVREPQAFLMDEPLSNLDAKLRVQMRSEIHQLQRRLGVTTIYVTHDQTEAMTMGDRVAVIRNGLLQQVAEPQTLYDAPANLFVAGFIGSPPMNMVEAKLERENGRLVAAFGSHRLAIDASVVDQRPALARYSGRTVALGIRPENIEDAAFASDTPEERRLITTCRLREALGSDVLAHFVVDAPMVLTKDVKELAVDAGEDFRRLEQRAEEAETSFVARLNPHTHVREGEQIQLVVDTQHLHFFDSETGLAIER